MKRRKNAKTCKVAERNMQKFGCLSVLRAQNAKDRMAEKERKIVNGKRQEGILEEKLAQQTTKACLLVLLIKKSGSSHWHSAWLQQWSRLNIVHLLLHQLLSGHRQVHRNAGTDNGNTAGTPPWQARET